MVEEDKEDRWYFSRDVLLANSPSGRHGYDPDRELSCRQQAANLIQDMGQKLQVSQLCINTAIVYMHRFYVFHSLHAFPRNNIAAAALFLAAKVEEQPRKVEHVLKVAHMCLHRDNPSSLDIKSELYIEQANELTLNESIILQTLGFEVAIDHPHTHVVRCCQLVKASKDLAQTSYFMASNSLHLTTMCLQYKPTVVACFCIHLACRWSNWEIPRSSEGKDWFWYVNQTVTLELLEQMTSEFLIIFDKCPTKLKKKMMSMNQSTPVNFAAPGNAPQENYHFDEPRKLMGAEANRPPDGFVQMQRAVERPAHPQPVVTASAPAPAPSQVPPHQHPTRHMDYKEYKEKRDRAERERLLRESYQTQHPSSLPPPQHGPIKALEKAKPVAPSTAPQQQQLQPPQRSSTGVPSHKGYPTQTRPHPSQPVKEGPSHQVRPSTKEAIKRKFEEVDNTTGEFHHDPSHAKNPPEYRHKMQGHYLAPPPSYPQQLGDNYAQKEMAPSRETQQSYNPREKGPRVDEKVHPSYPYQRPVSEKYPPSGRSNQPPPTHHKTHREETKKPDDLPTLLDVPNDWQQKSVINHLSHGGVNYSVPGKTAPVVAKSLSSIPPIKSRDSKYKSQQSVSAAKDPSQKLLSAPPGIPTNQSTPSSHKKPPEKSADKSRNRYHEPVDRSGLPASIDKLLMGDDLRQKQPEPKRGYNDVPKKEKTPLKSKPPVGHSGHYKEHTGQQTTAAPPSLFDLPGMDLELPHLNEPVERPAKIARLDEKKKYDLFGETPPERKKADVFNADRRDDRKKIGLFGAPDDRKKFDSANEDRKRPEQFGFDTLKPAGLFSEQKPKTFTSIFSPDNNDTLKTAIASIDSKELKHKSDLHFAGFPKKSQSSLFSPPSVPSLIRPGGRSSTSSEREVMINSAVPFNMKNDSDKRQEDTAFSFFDTFDPKPIKEKPKNDISPLPIKAEPQTHTKFVPKEAPVTSKNDATQVGKSDHVPLIGAVIQPPYVPNADSAGQQQLHTRPPTANPLRQISQVGAIVYPPADKVADSKAQPASAVSPVSTVNLSNMVDMVDTRTNKAAVLKPHIVLSRIDTPAQKPLPVKEPETTITEEKARPLADETQLRKSEKKKSKDKDRDKESHRSRDKKKSDGKKDKKKHKDKDKERKKESHHDKERDSDRKKSLPDPAPASDTSLRITIPKDKITEVSGLKLKITKDKGSSNSSSKPVTPTPSATTTKPTAPLNPQESGSLKITIKKDAIANYKDDRKSSKKKDKDKDKEKESSSHSSSHKSSKSSKSSDPNHKSSKSSSGGGGGGGAGSSSSSSRVPSKSRATSK